MPAPIIEHVSDTRFIMHRGGKKYTYDLINSVWVLTAVEDDK